MANSEVMCTKYLQERKELVQALHKDIKLSDLPKITQPMLIIWGNQDQIFPLELAHRLKRTWLQPLQAPKESKTVESSGNKRINVSGSSSSSSSSSDSGSSLSDSDSDSSSAYGSDAGRLLRN
ncbi:hypothetical protein LOK49_LG07G00857 [Camellia lanceoleosa]|uniref:Uncharacterized protein n=1 Tax=Camellia lanceoleosa TaxID=1840588 RepID=A0ACC0GZI6_9ERIC|nr:hypothetical protein LOK49_LG07G00857 [Camellia lanceoleosa]